MSLDIKHECDECGNEDRKSECYCVSCKDEEVQKSYTDGYEQAKKDFNIKED